jgi:hypothetical protein
MPKATTSQEKKTKVSSMEEKETRKSMSKPKVESPYSKFVENVVKVSGKTENNGKRSITKAEEGEKQNKKSKSKKMEIKHQKKNEESSMSPKKEKSPSHKMKINKKNESKSGSRTRKLTSLGKKKKKEEEKEDESQDISQEKSTPKKRREREKSKSKSRSKRERSRTKSIKREKEEKSITKSVPSGQKEESDTPSKTGSSPTSKISGSSSKSVKYKEISTGKIPRNFTSHSGKKKIKTSKVKNLTSISSESQPQGSKKISVKNVKESSSNIESSSSIDLSAEQKKRVSELNYGPDSQRISQEVEEVIKRIENKKRQKPKLLEKKRNRDDALTSSANHTSKDFDYILQKNPNSKKKPYINLEDLSKHPIITYSDILLALLEVGKNSNSYLFAYSSKSKCFWTDILEYTILKKIFSDFKAETLRKYWSELSKYDTEDTTDLIKKNKSYLDKLPLKLGTIVSSISKMLSGKIKDLKEYIDNIQMDIRKREIFEHEFKNPETGEVTKVKEVRTTYRKRYEPGSSKDFNGSQINIVSLKEVYHQNSNLNDFQKVMKNIKKEDSIKNSYLNEKVEEEKRKMNTINEEDKFIFKAIDNVMDILTSEFKNYSFDFILETMKQNSMDIFKTYNCLKEPMKNRNVGFTALDDKVLLRKTGEEYKILLKEKGKEAIQEREEFLNH